MPAWSTDLPPAPQHRGFDLRRTPPDKPVRAIVTCETLHVCFTHFWGGRTRPCERPDCEACRAMSPARAHCYVSAFDPATKDHFLFECTASAAVPFQDWQSTYGSMRGCLFQASRPKRRRNSKVELLTKPCDLTKITLPNPPDVPLAMAVIWQLPGASIDLANLADGQATFAVDQLVADRMRVYPADAAPRQTSASGNGSR